METGKASDVFVLGITGGVGSGKSRVLSYLEERFGASLLSCDEIGRELQAKGGRVYKPIVALFGEEALLPDGELDRGKIARAVFSDPDLLQRLNGIVHPAVKEEVQERILAVQESLRHRPRTEGETGLICVEAALLLEGGYRDICREIWYIYASESVRKKRLMESRGYPEERVMEMFRSQRSDRSFRENTDFSIDNSGNFETETIPALEKAVRERVFSKNF